MAQTYETDGGRQERMRPLFNGGSQAAAAGGGGAPPASSGGGATAAIPGEGVYQQQQALAQKAYQEAIASLQANRMGTQRQYGFLDDGSVDPNNTLGLYQQDRRAYAQDLAGAEEHALARGLGHSGLGAQVAEAPRYEHEVQSAGLMRQYLDALGQNSADQVGAANDLQSALLTARQQQLQSAIDNGDFTPADTSGPDDSSPGGTSGGTRTTQSASTPAKNGSLDAQRALLARSLALNAKYGLGKKTTTYRGRH